MNEIEIVAPAPAFGLAWADAVEAAKLFFRENPGEETFTCVVADAPGLTQVVTSRDVN